MSLVSPEFSRLHLCWPGAKGRKRNEPEKKSTKGFYPGRDHDSQRDHGDDKDGQINRLLTIVNNMDQSQQALENENKLLYLRVQKLNSEIRKLKAQLNGNGSSVSDTNQSKPQKVKLN